MTKSPPSLRASWQCEPPRAHTGQMLLLKFGQRQPGRLGLLGLLGDPVLLIPLGLVVVQALLCLTLALVELLLQDTSRLGALQVVPVVEAHCGALLLAGNIVGAAGEGTALTVSQLGGEEAGLERLLGSVEVCAVTSSALVLIPSNEVDIGRTPRTKGVPVLLGAVIAGRGSLALGRGGVRLAPSSTPLGGSLRLGGEPSVLEAVGKGERADAANGLLGGSLGVVALVCGGRPPLEVCGVRGERGVGGEGTQPLVADALFVSGDQQSKEAQCRTYFRDVLSRGARGLNKGGALSDITHVDARV